MSEWIRFGFSALFCIVGIFFVAVSVFGTRIVVEYFGVSPAFRA